MYCPLNFDNKRMEKELLRNLQRTAVNDPSRSDSILKSFVKDLCFWTIDGFHEPKHCGGWNSSRTEFVLIKQARGMPTMKEATDMDVKGNLPNEDDSDHSVENSSDAIWKSAMDPASGKIYYYDTITRKTQWKKPAKLKELEKRKKKERRRIAKEFFNEMEKNILDSLSRGEVIPGIPIHKTKAEGPPKELLPKSHVRTISAMHGVLLEELGVNPNTTLKESGNETPKYQKATQRNSASMSGRPPLPEFRRSVQDVEKTSTQRNSVSSEKLSRQKMGEKITDETNQKPVCDLAGEKILDAPINDKLYELRHDQIDVSTRPSMGHTRRNTGGTIYLQNSMANPDVKATIKCVCGVYRAHIGQSKKHAHACRNNNAKSISKFGVFDDNFGSRKRRGSTQVPSLTEIVEFYEAFYERSQMEHDTIIFSLIYIERLIKSTNGTLAPSPGNWRSFLFSCMVLASKVWDDLSMWNNDFANVTAHTVGLTLFTLPRINELELALLKCLEFDVKVSASEYAKYYFLIRTMLLRSGLVKEDEKPLGKRKAFEKLEALTNPNLDRYPASESRDRRSKSMDGGIFDTISNKDLLSGDPVLNDSVCLEQLVN